MATLAEIGGKVRFEEATKGSLLNIIVTADDGDNRIYSVPHTGLRVNDGDVIAKGTQLQDGALSPHDTPAYPAARPPFMTTSFRKF